MPNWTVKITGAALSGNSTDANIVITLTATNSITSEVQTRVIPGNSWTVNALKAYAEQLIATLVARDIALPVAQAAATAQTVLATG